MSRQGVFWLLIGFISLGMIFLDLGKGAWLVWGFVVISILFYFSINPHLGFFIQSITRTIPGNVLLTFDDGPDPERTPAILEILRKHEAKAMFFLIGRKIEGQEKLIQDMAKEGHMIGSHSQNHLPWMGFMGRSQVEQELGQAHSILQKVVPYAGNWFRPPFGVTNPILAKASRKLGLQSVAWTVRSFDTARHNPENLVKTLLSQIKGSDIVLLHDTQQVTVDALEALILGLKKKNYTLKAQLK